MKPEGSWLQGSLIKVDELKRRTEIPLLVLIKICIYFLSRQREKETAIAAERANETDAKWPSGEQVSDAYVQQRANCCHYK